MGVSNNDGIKEKSKGRGATNVSRSLAGLGQAPAQADTAHWESADFSWVAGIIVETTKRGGAASFGLSRDKGAYNVTILMDGERKTVWISSSDDMNGELEKIYHFMKSLP